MGHFSQIKKEENIFIAFQTPKAVEKYIVILNVCIFGFKSQTDIVSGIILSIEMVRINNWLWKITKGCPEEESAQPQSG